MTAVSSLDTSSRAAFDRAVTAGDALAAARHARTLLKDDPSNRQYGHVRRAVATLAARGAALKSYKVALLSSFSIEFVQDPLVAHALTEGLAVEIYQPGFDQYRQEILTPSSGLYRFSPDAVILAVDGARLVPALYDTYLQAALENGDAIVAEAESELRGTLAAFRARSTAPLLIHNLAPPTWRELGILDGHVGSGQVALVHRINERLLAVVREFAAVYVVDYAALVARAGTQNWYDLRMAHFAKQPLSQLALGMLAREYLKFLRALTGRARKCVVVDLDNTMWGGIVGEDGVEGIAIGAEYPGSAFRDFQAELAKLRRRGVLIAIASKNNPGDVDEVFAARDEMVLKKDDFSDVRISWQPKEQSLKEIAEKLNLGLEHMVFVDDSPIECGRVAEALPMLTVIQFPKQPERSVTALLEDGFFDGLSLTEEDLARAEMYKQRDQAESLRASAGSIEEFYRQLNTEIEIAPVDKASLARTSQMTQKTNQFNTTTIRFSEADIAGRLADPNWVCATVRVKDRFGDSGITGLMMAHVEKDRMEIETFLLSCRVIGRGVETSMLAALREKANARALKRLSGKIVPTKRNVPVRNLYSDHAFRQVAGDGEGKPSEWEFDVEALIVVPDWVSVVDRT